MDFLKNTATKIVPVKDKWGSETSNIETNFACRIGIGTKKVGTKNGLDVFSAAQVLTDNTLSFTQGDKIKINNIIYQIISIDQYPNYNGDFTIQYLYLD